jgi:GxxExxY protein
MPYEDEDPPFVEPDVELDELARNVIAAALEVHKRLGAGLDESLYRNALCVELRLRSIQFATELPITVTYKGETIGTKRLDLLVAGRLIVELKSVEQLTPLHKAQVLTYLRITGLKLALLINFNSILLKDGLKRIIRPT